MGAKQELELKTGGMLRHIPAVLGLTVAFLAFLGMWQLNPAPSFSQQDQLLQIGKGDSLIFEKDFANTSSGNLQNEGNIIFKGNITNYGRMGCGDCKSGRFFLVSNQDKDLFLRGTEPISVFEAILQGQGKLILENELRIHQHIQLDSVRVSSKKEDISSKGALHFLPQSSYTFSSEPNYVESWVGRTGHGLFCFPVGSKEGKRYLFLKGRFPKSSYKVKYLPAKETEDRLVVALALSREFRRLKDMGVWMIKGEEETPLIFELEQDQGLLTIIGYQNGKWHSLGATRSSRGLSTEKALIPNTYEAFSLAKFAK